MKLFWLLGTTYGGDGRVNYALPRRVEQVRLTVGPDRTGRLQPGVRTAD